MKSKVFVSLFAGLCLFFSSCNEQSTSVSSLNSIEDTVSYVIGMQIAQQYLVANKLDSIVNVKVMAQGIKDKLEDIEYLINEEGGRQAANLYFQDLQKEQMEKQEAMMKEQFSKNIEEADAFFAKNKQKEGVKTTESGLQYEVIKTGTGKKPQITDTVKVHYHGTLLNGNVFDSSVERGEPIEFPVNGVIQGWTEALMMMSEGAKWEIYVPSELAYGSRPRPGGSIEPYMALVFEVELIEVVN